MININRIVQLQNYWIIWTDLYEIHSKIIKDICRQEFNKVEQASKQSFNEFYCAFVKYSIFRNKDDLIYEMRRKVNSTLRKVFLFYLRISPRYQSWQNDLKKWIIIIVQQNNKSRMRKNWNESKSWSSIESKLLKLKRF